MTYKSEITSNNPQAWLELIWQAVEFYKEEGIPADKMDLHPSEIEDREAEQDDLNTAMAWIAEELGVDDNPDGGEDQEPARETSDDVRWRAEQRYKFHEQNDTLDQY